MYVIQGHKYRIEEINRERNRKLWRIVFSFQPRDLLSKLFTTRCPTYRVLSDLKKFFF